MSYNITKIRKNTMHFYQTNETVMFNLSFHQCLILYHFHLPRNRSFISEVICHTILTCLGSCSGVSSLKGIWFPHVRLSRVKSMLSSCNVLCLISVSVACGNPHRLCLCTRAYTFLATWWIVSAKIRWPKFERHLHDPPAMVDPVIEDLVTDVHSSMGEQLHRPDREDNITDDEALRQLSTSDSARGKPMVLSSIFYLRSIHKIYRQPYHGSI